MDSKQVIGYQCNECGKIYLDKYKADKCCRAELDDFLWKIDKKLRKLNKYCKITYGMYYDIVKRTKINFIFHQDKYIQYKALLTHILKDEKYLMYSNNKDVKERILRIKKLIFIHNIKYHKYFNFLLKTGDGDIRKIFSKISIDGKDDIGIIVKDEDNTITRKEFDAIEFIQCMIKELI